jgi:hypothetical protein
VLAHGKDIANLREGLCIRLRRQLPTACCGLSRRIKFLHIDPDELARAQPRPPMVPGGVGSVGNHTAETDCVPEDAVRSEKVSRAVLPAICDFAG